MINWKTLLTEEIEYAYSVTEKLIDLVQETGLEWKPTSGSNWMTTGQLLMHITTSCGLAFKGFITGDWGMPEGMDMSDLPPEEMLPPAEKLPSVETVAQAKQMLADDKKTALELLINCPEEDLTNKMLAAPWDPSEMILGRHLLQMVYHLSQHKGQLFYYLKLQGKPVNTGHLWGA